MAEPKFIIDGQVVDAPRNWNDLEVLATFDKSSPQANISTTEINFVNQSAVDLINYVLNGADGSSNGALVGLPIEIEVTEPNTSLPSTIVFNGMIDSSEFKVIKSNECEVKIKDLRGLETLESLTEGLTFGLLVDKGVITSSDYVNIPYLVQKEFDPLAVAITSLSIYSIVTASIERLRQLLELPAEITAHATGGATGVLSAAIYAVAIILIRVANLVLLIIQMKKLMDSLLEYLSPKVRYFKGMKVQTMFEKALGFLGYGFNTSISQFNNLYYLPSKQAEGLPNILLTPPSGETGIPRVEDTGYIFVNLMESFMKMFAAKINVGSDDVVNLEPLNNDAYWIQQSTFEKPDVLVENYRFNSEDVVTKRIVSFQTDVSDTWTRTRYTGTAYEITTEPLNITDKRYNLIKGIDDIRIPFVLGTRKDDLTVVEQLLFELASSVDSVISGFGSSLNALIGIWGGSSTALTNAANSNYAGIITNKIGMLRISENLVSTPRLLYLNNDDLKMPSNHRDLFSAKVLYDQYINYYSFVSNNYGGQYKVYEGVKIPFALSDFLKLIDNSYFYDSDGSKGQITKVSWKIGEDYAMIDYRVQQVWTTNLQETIIEP